MSLIDKSPLPRRSPAELNQPAELIIPFARIWLLEIPYGVALSELTVEKKHLTSFVEEGIGSFWVWVALGVVSVLKLLSEVDLTEELNVCINQHLG
jgi:hypothetical protein